ncbi:hypothetical protein MMC07_007541 [Pseudocyphellaria aurata]|nr:hypothetical protein [Pseudocyphellaria aurata]
MNEEVEAGDDDIKEDDVAEVAGGVVSKTESKDDDSEGDNWSEASECEAKVDDVEEDDVAEEVDGVVVGCSGADDDFEGDECIEASEGEADDGDIEEDDVAERSSTGYDGTEEDDVVAPMKDDTPGTIVTFYS